MPTKPNSLDSFVQAIHHAIEVAIEEESKKILKTAVETLELRVRERVAAMAIRIASSASITTLQNELLIKVKMD